jgi:[acyl-carrier-protein] S-malonyltransferase
MGQGFAEADPEARALFDRASSVLGYDLAKVCFEGPADELTASDRAQPAIFLVSVAAYEALKKARPDLAFAATAGLSSGEWCALYVAGVVSFEDAVRVLEARGRFMQVACKQQPGSMLSVIGLPMDTLKEICAKANIEIANLNSPEQVVLSGPVDGIEAAEKLATEAGAKRAIRLNVAGAFHSVLMKSAAEQFGEFLKEVPMSAPQIPVLANVTGAPHTNPEEIKRLMVEQITDSVRWVDCIQNMQGQGIDTFVECGPGKVLSGLIKRIDKGVSLHNIQDPTTLESALAAL